MKKRSSAGSPARHISYANVVATMALFIALGGISWAAATAPKNSVASKSIKKNAVTNAKIKNNAVTGRKIKSSTILSSDVKNEALTGSDINEGTLGAVPESAKSSNQVINAVTGTSTASNSDPNVARTQASEVLLASYGSVSVYGKCFTDSDDNSVSFETIAKASAAGSALGGDSSDETYANPSLGPATLETDRQVQTDGVGNNGVDSDYSGSVSLVGPDGKGLLFHITSYGRAGNPIDPTAVLPAGNSCRWEINGVTLG